MNDTLIITIVSSIASALGGGFGVAFLMKNKTKAEAHKLEAETEVTLGDGWRTYAIQMQHDLSKLREEMGHVHNKALHLEKSYNDLKDRYEDLETRYTTILSENVKMKGEIVELQGQLATYKKRT